MATVHLHGLTAAEASDYGAAGGALILTGHAAELHTEAGTLRTTGDWRGAVFMAPERAVELATLVARPGLLDLARDLLAAIDPRLAEVEDGPQPATWRYRDCIIGRLPLAAPWGGWEWQHEDAEPGLDWHGTAAALLVCLDQIDDLAAELADRVPA